jgi:hypothetical protein
MDTPLKRIARISKVPGYRLVIFLKHQARTVFIPEALKAREEKSKNF